MAVPSSEHEPGLKGKGDVDTAAMITVSCLVGGIALERMGLGL